jgi:Na+-transporting methylmalonyl-CoA/oxaloacetate decarboxylase gamma subunit
MDWRNRSGVAVVFLVLVVVLVVIVIVGGVSFFAFRGAKKVVQVPEDVCQCPDLADIENRVKEAGAGAGAFAKMANTQAAADAAAGTTTTYTDALYLQGKNEAQAAVNAAHAPGARTGTGETGSDCTTEITAPTECLRAALQSHENVHSATCDALKAAGKVGKLGDYKFTMSIADYWRNEVAAYSEELNYLGRQLARLKSDPACKPKAAVKVETYPGSTSKEAQQERLAGAFRRVTSYVSGII